MYMIPTNMYYPTMHTIFNACICSMYIHAYIRYSNLHKGYALTPVYNWTHCYQTYIPVYECMNKCIHTYMHTYIHACMHTYIPIVHVQGQTQRHQNIDEHTAHHRPAYMCMHTPMLTSMVLPKYGR